jgi:putative membrane protein
MTRMKTLAVLMMLGMGVWLAGLSAAADEQKEGKGGGDQDFVKKASACGLAEVNLSELALRLARDPAVKQFAQQMVNDHMRAVRELTAMANQRSIALPKEMNEKHKEIFDKLKTLSGEKFDREYMEAMVKDHEEVVKLFENASKDGKNEAVKEWAGKLTPIMKKHLEHAQEICKNVKGEKTDKEEKK